MIQSESNDRLKEQELHLFNHFIQYNSSIITMQTVSQVVLNGESGITALAG